MYNQVGKKLKFFAWIVFIAMASLFFLLAIIATAVAIDEEEIVVALVVIPVSLCGGVMAYVISLFLYGFADVVDKLYYIEKNTNSGKGASPQDDNDSIEASINSEREEKLSRLELLRSKGLITEEEYNEKIKQYGKC